MSGSPFGCGDGPAKVDAARVGLGGSVWFLGTDDSIPARTQDSDWNGIEQKSRHSRFKGGRKGSSFAIALTCHVYATQQP